MLSLCWRRPRQGDIFCQAIDLREQDLPSSDLERPLFLQLTEDHRHCLACTSDHARQILMGELDPQIDALGVELVPVTELIRRRNDTGRLRVSALPVGE